MITGMYSVLDKAVGAFLPPFFARSRGEALRSFMDAAVQDGHQFARHAADYELFQIGEFDDTSGEVAPKLERIISAIEVTNKEKGA